MLASRISYVGDLGWELYVPIEQGAKLWDMVWEAGEPHGVVPAGIGVYGTTGRLEKCYRAFGFELDGEYDVVEAGMAWGKVKDAGLRRQGGARAPPRAGPGRGDVHAHRRRPHARRAACKRYMLGGEPILTRDGAPLTDAKGRRSFVTSAGAGPSVGKHLLMSYLPPEHADVGEELAVRVHGRALPGDGRGRRLDAALRPRQRARQGGRRGAGMRILVCVKRVPLTGGKMVLTADEQAIETRHLGFTISPHEECGVEEAVRLVEAARRRGDRADARAARGRGADPRRLAIGADRGILLDTDGEEWDAQATRRGDRRRDARRGATST